jgi:ABC-type polysaccharide/polyol phosphate transport system ATPase subunit
MRFRLCEDKIVDFKEYASKFLMRKIKYREFWALKDVSFSVGSGEVFGVLGLNGAGKSTLLKIVAGVFKPTGGSVSVNGSLVPLLELGAGFDPELSALDNICLNGAMYGYSPKYMAGKYDEILDFAELKDFAAVALKNYSSGMKARLGFAVATCVKPEILIVDEVLAVGDYKFKAKCQERIASLISDGITVLLVSHDIAAIKKMCSRAMLLKNGEVVSIGGADEVCGVYEGK